MGRIAHLTGLKTTGETPVPQFCRGLLGLQVIAFHAALGP